MDLSQYYKNVIWEITNMPYLSDKQRLRLLDEIDEKQTDKKLMDMVLFESNKENILCGLNQCKSDSKQVLDLMEIVKNIDFEHKDQLHECYKDLFIIYKERTINKIRSFKALSRDELDEFIGKIEWLKYDHSYWKVEDELVWIYRDALNTNDLKKSDIQEIKRFNKLYKDLSLYDQSILSYVVKKIKTKDLSEVEYPVNFFKFLVELGIICKRINEKKTKLNKEKEALFQRAQEILWTKYTDKTEVDPMMEDLDIETLVVLNSSLDWNWITWYETTSAIYQLLSETKFLNQTQINYFWEKFYLLSFIEEKWKSKINNLYRKILELDACMENLIILIEKMTRQKNLFPNPDIIHYVYDIEDEYVFNDSEKFYNDKEIREVVKTLFEIASNYQVKIK